MRDINLYMFFVSPRGQVIDRQDRVRFNIPERSIGCTGAPTPLHLTAAACRTRAQK